jgi:hypothetical protein
MSKDTDQSILQLHRAFQDRVKTGRQDVMRNCYENILFYLGHQWITCDVGDHRFRRLNLRKNLPQPVTNKFKATMDTIIAVAARVEASLAIAPGSDEDADRLTADIAIHCIHYLEKIVSMTHLRLRLAPTLLLLNDAYLLSGYDADGGTVDHEPMWTCPMHPEKALTPDKAMAVQGKCPKDGQPLQPDPERTMPVPQGVCTTDLLTPFEVWVDPTIKLIRDQPIVMVRRMRSLDELRRRYPAHNTKMGEEESPHDVGLTYLQSIIRLVPGSGVAGFGGGASFKNAAVQDDLYVMPCDDYPQGAMARIVNETVVVDQVAELPFHDGPVARPGKRFIPLAHFGVDEIPGAHYHTGAPDHLKSLQRQRNRLQASVELYFARMANGVWAVGQTADVKMLPGEEGGIIRYNDVGGAQPPRRIEGGRLPTSFGERFRQIDEEMSDIGGSYAIMRGERPLNVDSGYALNILQERAQGRHAALYLNLERAYAEWARQIFFIFRQHAPDELIFAIKGGDAQYSLQKIRSADLQGGVDIDIEPGSAQPQSLLQKRAAYEQAVQMGLLNPADPKERSRMLRAMGIAEVLTEFSADEDAILREQDAFLTWAKQVADEQGNPISTDPKVVALPTLVNPLVDNHALHFDLHRTFMLSEQYEALPYWVQQAWEKGHFLQHILFLGPAPGTEQEQPGGGQGGVTGASSGGEDATSRAEARGQGHIGRENRQADRQQQQGAAA